MADSQPIKSQDVIQKDLFKPTIKEAEDLVEALQNVEDGFKDVLEETEKILKLGKKGIFTADDINTQTEALIKAEKARQALIKTEKDRVKLEQELENSKKKQLQVERESEKLKQDTLKTEQQELKLKAQREKAAKKELNSYQLLAKRLNDNRKVLKNLAAEGQQNTKEFKRLQKEVSKLDKEIKDIDASAGQFQRNVGNYPETLRDAGKSLANFAKGAIAAKLSLDGLNEVVQSNEGSASAFQTVLGGLKGGFSAATNAAGGFLSALFEGKGLSEASESFKNFGDQVSNAAKAGANAAKEQREFEKALRPLREELTAINSEIERQSAIAGDSTRSFDEQEKATRAAQKATIERAVILEQIATKELEIIDQQIKARGEGANVEDLLNERTEKAIELAEAKNELDLATIENQKVLREVQRDRFERELDFAIDAFDAVKTINERIIADDSKTIEERSVNFRKLEALADSSFKNQIEILQDFAGERIDINELVALNDEEQVRERVRNAKLDDVTQGRVLEIFRERKFVVQDLADAERDLNDAIKERTDNQISSINELEQLQIQFEVDRLNELEKQTAESINARFELEKRAIEDAADFRIQNEELTAEEIEVIQQQAVNDIVNLTRAKNQELKDLDDELTQDLIDNQNAITDARLDSARSLLETAELIAGKNEELQRAIVAGQKALAIGEIIINSEREISQINADTDATQEEKRARTVAATARAIAGVAKVIATADSFYEGTEDTGTVNNPLDSNGGRWAILHDNERVMTAKQNSKVGSLTNEELADIAYNYRTGNLMSEVTLKPTKKIGNDNKRLEKLVSNLIDETKKKPVQQVNLDKLGNIYETIYKDGYKQTIKYKFNRKRI